MTTVDARPVEILLVEDSPSDTDLTVEALREAKVRNHLSIAEDGVVALEFLRREGKHAGAPRPDLIMLDLNLPRKDGREVLAEIKSDDTLKTIPVVVLTSSKEDKDVAECYQLGVNSYISKPVEFDDFAKTVAELGFYWLLVNHPPVAAK